MSHRVRRALLFMPGDDRHKIEKGAALDVDSLIMDLEDGVALSRKEAAREGLRDALKTIDFGRSERLIRLNPIIEDGGMWKDDIEAVIEGKPDGFVVPKVENAEQLATLSEHLSRVERKYGWLPLRLRLLAIIESARGVINLNEIAASTPRLSALIFGAEDLAGDIGAVRTSDGWEVFYARSAVVLHARAYGLQAIDTPYVELTSEDSNLIAAAEQAHYMGYTGKLVIHPRHVDPVQQVFTPSQQEIDEAKALIEAHRQHQEAGEGAFAYKGRMVDMPMVRSAEWVLSRARAAGIDVDG